MWAEKGEKGAAMTLRSLFRIIQDVLSGFGIAILAIYGLETAEGASTMSSFQHRWVGYLVLISAVIVAHRIRVARKAGA